jgi:glycosyltransferase involved in cell wall biosynthesis
MTPLVSIITPSYNQAAFLETTIRSVLGQDYPNIEYLVIDGASTDGSVDVIKKYAHRLTWWVSEKDKGQAEAINKGLARAKGEYVAWVNSDDHYFPGAVGAAVKVFSEHPEAALVYGDVAAIDAAGNIFNRMTYGNWGLEGLLCFKIIGQPSVFIRRSALEKAGYLDMKYHFMLDTQLWMRVAQYGEMIYVPELWSAARYHADAKNVAQAPRFGEDAFTVYEWMQQEPGLQDFLNKNRNKILAGLYRFNARYLLDGDKPKEAFHYYVMSLQKHAPSALAEWKRILYCLVALLGFSGIRRRYLDQREKQFHGKNEGMR